MVGELVGTQTGRRTGREGETHPFGHLLAALGSSPSSCISVARWILSLMTTETVHLKRSEQMPNLQFTAA